FPIHGSGPRFHVYLPIEVYPSCGVPCQNWPRGAESRRQRRQELRSRSPSAGWEYEPRLLPATDPRPSCQGEATVELMTARLRELVNTRRETYRPVLCLSLRRACLLRVKRVAISDPE